MDRRERRSSWRKLNRGGAKLQKWRAGLVVISLLALIVLNTTDYWMELFESGGECSSLGQGISGPDQFLYRHLMIRRGELPGSRVSLVMIGAGDGSDLLTDVCSGRRFTAYLLDALNRLGADVIALDKVYGQGTCRDEGANAALVAAAERSRSKLVVGQGTHHPSSREASACLVKSSNFTFGRAALQRGLTVLNKDDLKIPLRWPVYASDEESGRGGKASDKGGDTFALVTAETADPELAGERHLVENLDRHSHPYGDYRRRIDPLSATEVLCSEPASKAEFVGRGGVCPKAAQPLDLRGRVVIVASESPSDVHPFLEGEIPGAMLQAQYVDALLTRQYISELPFWGCVIAFVLWLTCVLLLLNVATAEAHGRVLAAIAATLAVITMGLVFGLQRFEIMPPFSFLLAAWLVVLFEGASHLLEVGKEAVLKDGE